MIENNENAVKKVDFDIEANFPDLFDNIDANDLTSNDASVLVYVSGYIAFSVGKRIKCEQCSLHLCIKKDIDLEDPEKVYEYVRIIDRGGLKWPTDFLLTLCTNTFLIFKKLISLHEKKFIKFDSHREILMKCALEFNSINFEDEECPCKRPLSKVMKFCLWSMSNILLNNYVKNRNDQNIQLKKTSKRKNSFVMVTKKILELMPNIII